MEKFEKILEKFENILEKFENILEKFEKLKKIGKILEPIKVCGYIHTNTPLYIITNDHIFFKVQTFPFFHSYSKLSQPLIIQSPVMMRVFSFHNFHIGAEVGLFLVGSSAEENALCYPDDRFEILYNDNSRVLIFRYKGYDLTIHEFAHSLANLGLKYAFSSFESKLKQLYQNAK